MVHVSDGGGRHKMLAFSTEPNINIASVKDESNISSITETTTATTTVVVANGRGVKAINLINSTNLSIIAEEPQIIMSNNAAEESTLQVVFNNGNNDMDKDAANGNNNINATEGNNRDLTNNVNGNYQTVNSAADDEAKNTDKSKVVKRNNKINNNGKHLSTATAMRNHHSSPNSVRAAASSNGATKRLRDSFEEKTVPQTDVVLTTSTPTKLKPDTMTNNMNEKNPEEPATPVSTTPVVMKTGKSANGNKSAGLKRVSFGSSKGSMVETLIFETPVSEDPGSLRAGNNDSQLSNLSNNKSSHHHHHHHHRNSGDPNDQIESSLRGSTGGSRPPSRVRVTFFEQEKPLAVSSPESDIGDYDLSSMTLPGSPNAMDRTMSPAYNRHISAEAGWDNPFRPDGDLSKEADQIVELIKEGKPINDETLRSKSPSVNEAANTVTYNNALNATSGKGVNGSAANGGNLVVQSGVVAPAGATVEHVTLKKKKGCCVIQ